MSGSVLANREELMQDFVDSFDVFIAALAEHGAAAKSAGGFTIAMGGPPPKALTRLKDAQTAFDAARDQLVQARERLGPMRLTTDRLSVATDGISVPLWTPGRPRGR